MDENPKESKVFSEDDLKEKIKEHKKTLEQITTEGKRVSEQRQSLTNQLNQIVEQSTKLIGAIATLQDLIKNEGKGDS